MMARSWTETELSAYLDGELEGDARTRVERLIADDPEARETLEELRRTDALLRAAFAAPMTETPPLRLEIPRESPGAVVALRPRWRARTVAWAPAALAASVALVVGGVLGALVGEPTRPSAGASLAVGPASTSLAAALDAAPSGALLDGVRPVASFPLPGSGVCREFELASDEGAPAAFGLACARGAGWRVLIAGAVMPAGGPAEDDYVAASGAALDAAGAVLDALNAGPAMTPDEERAALARGWR